MRKMYQAGLILLAMALIAACGSVATPRYEADRIIAEAEEEATRIVEAAHDGEVESQAVAEEPTEVSTEIPPTAVPTEVPTEIPPTAVPTEVPTEIPPTAVPTEAPAEEGGAEGIEAEIMAAVDAADASAGEGKFLATGCTGCHQTSDLQIVGPGLADVFNRSGEHGEHVEGQGPYEYVFTSIRNSQAFIVEGFAAGLMPVYTPEQLSDQDIYNLMAYLRQFSD